MKKFFCIFLALLMVIGLCACGSNGATTEQAGTDEWEGIDIKFAYNANDVEFLTEMGEAIQAGTDGKVRVTMYPKESFGKNNDVVAMIRDGAVDITQMTTAGMTDFPVCHISGIPFLSPNSAISTEIMYALKDAGYMDYDFQNIHPLMMWCSDGHRVAFTDSFPESVADWQGLKIRSTATGGIDMLSYLGGSGVTVETADLYLSLETGVIDGAFSSPSNMVTSGFDEVCDYVMSDVVFSTVSCVLMSEATWQKIPAEYQVIITDICEEYRYKYAEQNYRDETDSIEYLTSKGVEFVSAPADVIAALEEFSEVYLDEFIEEMNTYGLDGEAIVDIAKTTVARFENGLDIE